LINKEQKERLTDYLALMSVPGVGRLRYRKLVGAFGSPAAALDASKDDLSDLSGITPGLAERIKVGVDYQAAREMASRIDKLDWTVLFTDDPEYPTNLTQIDDYPPVLYRLGHATLPHEKMIAIVGTRRCTDQGRHFTRQLARDLAEAGLVIVSGMAEGIDGAAHQGALDVSCKTVAVWGTSLDIVYPKSHRRLAKEILDTGTVYSEVLPGTPVDKGFFPERNRIISGISEGVIVVEAGEKSGALITAEQALEQGRELLAVPGSPGNRRSSGTNRLIKSGAVCLTSAEDVFDAMPGLQGQVCAGKIKLSPEMTAKEREMVDHLAAGPVQLDQLSRLTDLPVTDLLSFLLALELKGVIQEISGKRFCLSDSVATSTGD